MSDTIELATTDSRDGYEQEDISGAYELTPEEVRRVLRDPTIEANSGQAEKCLRGRTRFEIDPEVEPALGLQFLPLRDEANWHVIYVGPTGSPRLEVPSLEEIISEREPAIAASEMLAQPGSDKR